MISLFPITMSHLLSAIQIVVMVGGFWLSLRSLAAARESIQLASHNIEIASKNLANGVEALNTAGKNLELSTRNAQAQLYNQMLSQGRDLQLKFMDVLVRVPPTAEDEKKEFHNRVSLSIGILIAYYAGCFELRQVLELPVSAAKLLDNDVRESWRDDMVRKKWDKVKQLHSTAFGEYVEKMRGVS